jgi:uncharacterized membrane protein
MLTDLPIRIEQPLWLVLLLLLIPAYLLSRRSIGGMSSTKAHVTFAMRAVVITILAVALAEPSWQKRGKGLTATIVLDRSQSIPVPLKTSSLAFLRQAAEMKERREDRVAVITVAKEANIAAMADPYTLVEIGSDEGDLTGTNLAAAIELALAIMPDDTANRIVVASDGNETAGAVLAAAELARANNVPIDILALEFEYESEVIFEQIIAPARARQGQTAKVRLVLRSQADASGSVRLRLNGAPLDLNGDAPGDELPVVLEPGTTVLEQTIALDESGPHQFDGVFIPDDSEMDHIDRNNTAVAVTFVGGQGKVLVVDDGVEQSKYLVQALREAGVTVDLSAPDALVGGLVFLSAYDTVVLVNIPRWALDTEQDRMLHAYVHDLGGGLVMIGGDQGFGAGGWIDTELARALPVQLNPPDTRQMPAGALALIMHSCEMAQGNFWGQKVAESAIEALSRLDYVGIIEFGFGAQGGINGVTWAFPMQRLGDKRAALQACKTMSVGDMPSFAPSMQLAYDGLTGTKAAQRHTIIISDGDPQPPPGPLLQQFVDKNITVTTVMVGGHGTAVDRARMRGVANKTGGKFYDVKNPKQLPQIFIKEARLISRSLIQDGDVYAPSVISRLPGPTQGFEQVPAIDGYVLTAPRDGLAQTPIVIGTEDGNDPLVAHWNYGLGRSLAYTSDLTNLWGSRWAGWEWFRAFWEQAIRWTMRPSSPSNIHVNTHIDGDMAVIEVEALESDASSLNLLRMNGVVIRPDAEAETVPLQQIGPGLYRGQFRTDEAGAYLVNVSYVNATGEGSQVGNIQAAVTVPYSREFREVKHNRATLEQLAEMTGGRMLNANDPRLADLFYRGDLEVPRTLKRVWDLLAILAATLLLFDVAARRISIDPQQIRRMAGRAVGARGEISTDTVAAWKRTRARVTHGQSPADQAAVRETRSRQREQRTARFEANEADRHRAIDVGSEQPGDTRAAAPERARPDAPAADAGTEDEGEYTSRLLAAKRRARGGDEGDGGGGGGDA